MSVHVLGKKKNSSLNYCTNSVLSLMTIIFTLMPESPSGCGSPVLAEKEGEGKETTNRFGYSLRVLGADF